MKNIELAMRHISTMYHNVALEAMLVGRDEQVEARVWCANGLEMIGQAPDLPAALDALNKECGDYLADEADFMATHPDFLP